MVWKPHVTVAAVVEKNGQFLVVEETIGRELKINQPAGHLEDAESLVDAVIRETLEETAWHFVPSHVVGVYRWREPENGRTTLRSAFAGECTKHEPKRRLDRGIVRAMWSSRDELLSQAERLRTPLVLRCVDDYLAGTRYPLQLLADVYPE